MLSSRDLVGQRGSLDRSGRFLSSIFGREVGLARQSTPSPLPPLPPLSPLSP